MPKQPGTHVFALPGRPKQTRRRRKKAPGASDGTGNEKAASSSRPLTRKLETESSSSTGASSMRSSSSGSSLGIGPIRQRRARRTNQHYDNWIESTSDNRSPSSTEGTAPKTPESWGSPAPMISPPAQRRNAISGGFGLHGIEVYPQSRSPSQSVVGYSSGYEDSGSHSPNVVAPYDMSHNTEQPGEPSLAGGGDFTGSPIVQNYNQSSAPAPYAPSSSYLLSTQVFNSVERNTGLLSNHASDVWNNFPDNSQPQLPFQTHYSQAASCFGPSYPETDPSTASFGFNMTPCPELEPLSTSHEISVPGAYPASDMALGFMGALGGPSIIVDDWDSSSHSHYDAATPFAAPNE
ncbi:hypothetical protein RhiJN_25552 [Ceratobasidium sp. AG-Ba]|nr:hypothetical protein RhiJN_25552 [Ceratobasidium sp. AG-Ba]